MTKDTILCPSACCESGAILLGIVLPDGKVAFARDRVVVDESFVQIARNGRAPESRFRFSTSCAREACKQWTGERCGVIDMVLQHLGDKEILPPLSECSIRPQCRWYQQVGRSACSVCPLVITDTSVIKFTEDDTCGGVLKEPLSLQVDFQE